MFEIQMLGQCSYELGDSVGTLRSIISGWIYDINLELNILCAQDMDMHDWCM